MAAALARSNMSVAFSDTASDAPNAVANKSALNGAPGVGGDEWCTPPRVLLVEDDAICRKLSGKLLSIFGCTFDVAQDGLAAVKAVNSGQYDVVLMDIVMPRMDGVSAASQIRQFNTWYVDFFQVQLSLFRLIILSKILILIHIILRFLGLQLFLSLPTFPKTIASHTSLTACLTYSQNPSPNLHSRPSLNGFARICVKPLARLPTRQEMATCLDRSTLDLPALWSSPTTTRAMGCRRPTTTITTASRHISSKERAVAATIGIQA